MTFPSLGFSILSLRECLTYGIVASSQSLGTVHDSFSIDINNGRNENIIIESKGIIRNIKIEKYIIEYSKGSQLLYLYYFHILSSSFNIRE